MLASSLGETLRNAAWVAFLLMAASAPSVSQAQSQALGRMALDPQGARIAYAEDGVLWIQAVNRAASRTEVDRVEDWFPVPTWSPSGARLAYYSRRTGELQLWLYDPKSGRSSQLTHLEGGIVPDPMLGTGSAVDAAFRFSWSPDEQSIIFASGVPGAGTTEDFPAFPSDEQQRRGAPIVLTNRSPKTWTLHGVTSYGPIEGFSTTAGTLNTKSEPVLLPHMSNQLFIVDVRSGGHRQITHDTRGYFSPTWAPDGRRIAFMSGGSGGVGLGMVQSDIFVSDLTTGHDCQITQGPQVKSDPAWAPDGSGIAYRKRDVRGTYIRAPESVDVVLVSGCEASQPREVTAGLDRMILEFDWVGSGEIVASYRDGLATPLIAVQMNERGFRRLSSDGAVARSFATAKGGVAWTEVGDPNVAPQLRLLSESGDGQPVSVRELPFVRGERQIKRVTWQNGRGDTLEGMLIYPVGFQQGKRYPLIVDAYGAGLLDIRSYLDIPVAKAALHYFIFRPNHRAPHMWINGVKSAAYDAAAVGPDGWRIMADDIMTGVDSLDREGLIDTDRMCVNGFSNGGLEGLFLIAETNRFRCGAFQSPSVPDFLSTFFLETDGGDTPRFVNNSDPWRNTASWIAMSPVYHADKINTPVLLAVGDKEGAVIPTVEMYNALRYLKKDVTLLRYPNMGHGFSGNEGRDFAERLRAFFWKYLH